MVWTTFLSHLIRALGKGNCFGGPSYYGDVAIFEFTVKKFREGLLEWYRKTEAEMVGARLTKIGDLTLKMLGTTKRPEVAFKGAETKWCLFYVQDLLKSDRIVSRLRRGEVWRATSQSICK